MAKLNYDELSVYEVYEALREGEIKCFPNGYLDEDVSRDLLRYVMLEEDKLTRSQICSTNFLEYTKKKKLRTVLKRFNTLHELVSFCFPELKIKPWELKKVEDGFWKDKNNRLKALLWLVNKEQIDLEDLNQIKRINAQLLHKYFGSRILKYSNNSLFELLDLYYEGKYKEWEIINKMGTWTDEKIIEAMHWMIDEKLKWTREDVCNNISIEVFKKFGLESMLSHRCRHCILIALKLAYPEYGYTKQDIKCLISENI